MSTIETLPENTNDIIFDQSLEKLLKKAAKNTDNLQVAIKKAFKGKGYRFLAHSKKSETEVNIYSFLTSNQIEQVKNNSLALGKLQLLDGEYVVVLAEHLPNSLEEEVGKFSKVLRRLLEKGMEKVGMK